MKKLMIATLAAILISSFPVPPAFADDEVTPANVTFNWLREEGVGQISSENYYELTTLRLTNCVIYAGTTTNSARQGLTSVTMELRIGNTTTNIVYTPTSQVATSGTWFCSITVPSNVTPCYLQMKLTDAVGTNVYIYPWKTLNWKTPLR
jgi:hypothetical protein